MARRLCWYCETTTHMTLIEASVREHAAPDNSHQIAQGAFFCDECKMMSLGVVARESSRYMDQAALALDRGDNLTWLPVKGVGRQFSDVPEHIASAASEAFEAASIKAHRAAVLMARSVIEATAKAKGHSRGSLADKIDAMRQADQIREHVKEAAHEIRHLGNDMAHGDFVVPVSKEEAEEVLDLMAEILHEVFQSPAKIEARKRARLARQSDAGSVGESR